MESERLSKQCDAPHCGDSSMIVRLFIVVLFLIASSARAEDAGELLPKGVGRNEMLGNCLACHSLSYITKARKTRDGWAKTVKTMQTKNGLWEIESQTLANILSYLEAHFGPAVSATGIDEYTLIRPRINPIGPP
jgi:hypothetical protein